MFATLACPNCSTYHTNVPVERDDCGISAHLETTPCHADDCTVRLCASCPQFTCDGCSLSHCEKHAVDLSGMKLCPVCMALETAEARFTFEMLPQADLECIAEMAAGQVWG